MILLFSSLINVFCLCFQFVMISFFLSIYVIKFIVSLGYYCFSFIVSCVSWVYFLFIIIILTKNTTTNNRIVNIQAIKCLRNYVIHTHLLKVYLSSYLHVNLQRKLMKESLILATHPYLLFIFLCVSLRTPFFLSSFACSLIDCNATFSNRHWSAALQLQLETSSTLRQLGVYKLNVLLNITRIQPRRDIMRL